MKIIKRILIVVVIIIAIPFVLAFFVPREFQSESEIVVDKPISEVFDYVQYVDNQDSFGVWQLSDPDAKVEREGTDGTVGYRYSWEGDKVGKGSQTITNIIKNEKVETELDFGFGEPAYSHFLTEEVAPNQTRVTWGISGRSPYPWNLMSLFYDMGEQFDEGLQNLKAVLEARESPDEDKIFALDYFRQTFESLEDKVSGLTNEQMRFKPGAEAWSISQCLEHIILTEDMIFGMLKETMENPANPELRSKIQISDEDIITMYTDRSHKFKAPEMLIAKGAYDAPEVALRDLAAQRTEILAFIEATPTEDLRNHVNDSPSGTLDAYQSLLGIAGHTARHTLQIEEVKANQNFPE